MCRKVGSDEIEDIKKALCFLSFLNKAWLDSYDNSIHWDLAEHASSCLACLIDRDTVLELFYASLRYFTLSDLFYVIMIFIVQFAKLFYDSLC